MKTQAQVSLRATDNEEKQQALQNVVNSVDRATHLVEQMLILARLDPSTDVLVKERINLNELAAEVIAQLVPSAMKRNTNIEITGNEDTFVYADPVSLSIMIRNLVDNAIRYTGDNGEVIVNIDKSQPDQVVLSVSDTGPGIEEELRERVFDRFYRVTGNSSIGCGLGLSIVKRIADLNNLRVELENKKDGNGLVASVHFVG